MATAIVAAGIFAGGTLLWRPAREKSVATPAASTGAPFIRAHAPVLGPNTAPVTIIEFFDPACEACRAFYPVVKRIMTSFPSKVRLVLRYAAFHPTSAEAIRILEAARRQGKFEAVLERLLETQGQWAPHGRPADSAWTVVEGLGLDLAQAKQDAVKPEVTALLAQDAEDVKAAGVRATPTFFVNGKPLQRFGAQELHDLVKSEVKAP
ncbi:DsbA family protein [Enhydrobacter aerosaccus]|uniref:DsbA family protein n=1 Tax=Enhydrobacter aerosaccus TaxID=225324 RepID=UPI001C4771A0|nr:thioredoxin domain-containing protein [Enhydrobacter aerosaccus]